MTMLNRSNSKANSKIVFSEDEIKILFECAKDNFNSERLGDCILQVAKLGGYLGRKIRSTTWEYSNVARINTFN